MAAVPSSAVSMFSSSSKTPISGGEFNNAAGDVICVKVDINHGDRQSNVDKMTSSHTGISGSKQSVGDGVCELVPSARGKKKLVSGGVDDHGEMSQRVRLSCFNIYYTKAIKQLSQVIEELSTYPSTEALGGGEGVDNQPNICVRKQVCMLLFCCFDNETGLLVEKNIRGQSVIVMSSLLSVNGLLISQLAILCPKILQKMSMVVCCVSCILFLLFTCTIQMQMSMTVTW